MDRFTLRLPPELARRFDAAAATRGGRSRYLRSLMETAARAPAKAPAPDPPGPRSAKLTLRLSEADRVALEAEAARAGLRARAPSPTDDIEAARGDDDDRPSRSRGGRRVCGGMWRGLRRCPGASRVMGAEPPRLSAVLVLAYLVYLQVDVFLLHGSLAEAAVAPSGGGPGPPPV